MHSFPIYQVDAFAEHPFSGNPAAVVPLKDWLPDALMQQIAMENNLSETAFFVPLAPKEMEKTGADYHIRWFTPNMEIDLCGHATLATAYVIHTLMGLEDPGEKVVFITEKAGLLKVILHDEWYTLELPSRPPEPTPTPDGLLEALGIYYPVRVMKSRDYFIVLPDQQKVQDITPDFTALKKIQSVGIIVTAPGDTADVVSRCFYPGAGVEEDPVTGSAHCNIIPYWSERLSKTELVCKQLSARGGTLVCVNKGPWVWMSGKCYLFLKGTFYLPAGTT
jgi:PhzF family phenazine biosynthesis protein